MIIKDWKMDFMEHRALSCTVPCSMYSVLFKHSLIPDPYYGVNERELWALSKNDCTFYTDITLSKSELNKERIELSFYCLDTLCDIYVNGVLIDSVKNMHRLYEYDIKGVAKDRNEIRLYFKSPVQYFEKMDDQHPLYTNNDTLRGAAHLRKALYMSGWDWAPTLPDMGILRPVEIKCYDGDMLGDVSVIQHHKNGSVTLELEAQTKHGCGEYKILCTVDNQSIELKNGKGEFKIEKPRLWWPNGYGKQELYKVGFSLYHKDALVDALTKEIGLRELSLSREDDMYGQEFCFKVNGIKIFAMGANYVPMENIIPNATNNSLERLIKDCVFANFNCIRVWGGAYYPDDYFYELCDRYGLIVWQDFMVACANINLTDEMADEFKKEATYNLKRIRHHACLGLVCGNNEMEEAICSWECANGNDPVVRRDYLKLYEDILPSVCKEHAPYISYTPSSPTSGGNFDDPQNHTRGDVHFWNVWNGNCEFDEYRKHKMRFCSEYGFESLPPIKTIEAFCPIEERNLLSYTVENHQKHYNGNVKLLRYLAEEYQMPKDLETTVYASQLNQANAIKYGVEHFRRCRGYTMGSIYWQLNDPWPVASWSSVDYYGRYKALHYFARRFYQPISLGLFNENGQMTLNVSNETTLEFNGYIKAGVIKNNLTRVSDYSCEVNVSALSSLDVLNVTNNDFYRKNDSAFYAELYSSDGTLLARSTELGTKPKHFKFLKPHIKIDIEMGDGGAYISLCSDCFVKSAQISFKKYDTKLSDNYFDLTDNKPYTVFAKTVLSSKELLANISVISVYDIPLKY